MLRLHFWESCFGGYVSAKASPRSNTVANSSSFVCWTLLNPSNLLKLIPYLRKIGWRSSGWQNFQISLIISKWFLFLLALWSFCYSLSYNSVCVGDTISRYLLESRFNYLFLNLVSFESPYTSSTVLQILLHYMIRFGEVFWFGLF